MTWQLTDLEEERKAILGDAYTLRQDIQTLIDRNAKSLDLLRRAEQCLRKDYPVIAQEIREHIGK